MELEAARGWLLVGLGSLSVLAGLSVGEPAYVTVGFTALGAEPLARAHGEVEG